ncbi:Na+/H+ antiporter subunit A [Virgibacillus sp. W0181]|uniref:Na+/H+ antiporter subunit A n=1 Tax=Virgibacillus sp. W0181 TaxID=3391581 RepID=UPI003F4833EA
MLTVILAILFPFLAALLILLLHKKTSTIHLGWFVMTVPFALFVLLAFYIPAIANGKTYSHTVQWIPAYHINFITNLDGLSMIFGLLITAIGTLVILYSIYYLSTDEALKPFYIYLLLFMGSMLGVVFSDHIMILYVFWELTSISSFLLIAYWYHRKGSRYGARKSLLITVFGGFAMLAGFIMLYHITGTFSIREMISMYSQSKTHDLFLPASILVLLGAFTKSAQFPFHIWLPDAMEAPTPVSAYLHSATMVKAGIYLVARFTPIFGGETFWFWAVVTVGFITLLWGAFCAVRQTDLKALLAYSTVSQLGLVMTLLGISSLAFLTDTSVETTLYTQAAFAALFHLVNHATFKGALFMVIGILDFRVGTRDIRRLGGLMAVMPASFTIALIGSFSMAGLPPFNGFLSKEMFFTSLLHVQQLSIFSLDTFGFLFPVIGWVASVFTFVYCLIIVFKTFFGTYRKDARIDVKEASPGMLIAPAVLSLFIILIFFFPNVLGKYLLRPGLFSIFPADMAYSIEPISAWHGVNGPLFMTIGILIVGSGLYVFYRYWRIIYTLFPQKWSLDSLYHHSLTWMENISNSLTAVYMTGYLRHYLLYIFIFFSLSISTALIFLGAWPDQSAPNAPIGSLHWMLSMMMIVAAVAILFAKTRLTAVLLNGFIGFSIAMFFVLFRAPDLALTQIVVETVTTALFLLCFSFLPAWKKEAIKRGKSVTHLLVAISVGVVFTVTALAVHHGQLFTSISDYFEHADKLAGGKNIVNTILGDFRAFDTMLEVIVIFVAGLGVYTLIKLTSKGGPSNEDQ